MKFDNDMENFAFDLTSKTNTHTEWLGVVRFGLGTLLENQKLLAEIICNEARQEAIRSNASHDASDHIASILAELGLKFVINTEKANG